MSDGFVVKIDGLDDLKKALTWIRKDIRTKAIRGALRDAARIIQQQAKANAPVLKESTPRRKPGTVKRAISVRRSKRSAAAGNEGVFVSVRPLRGARQKKFGKAGATNPNDPYYWWWVEFGHRIVPRVKRAKDGKSGIAARRRQSLRRVPGQFFMTRAAQQKGAEAVDEFIKRVVPRINALNEKAYKA